MSLLRLEALMKLSKILARELERSKGQIVIKKVPQRSQPSYESLRKADQIIAAQTSANEVMSKKSMQIAASSLQ